MPELPEVETIVRNYGPLLVGRRIVAFTTRWKKNCLPSTAAVRRGIVGRTIARVGRRGKFTVMQLDDGAYLLLHLRMSGRFEWGTDHPKTASHVRAVWTFDGGERLLFCDARKFGRLIYTRDLAAATAELGVEPLGRGFTIARLKRELSTRARQLKPLLLDQSVIAGLGNIYADESLFRAGLHPLLRSNWLGDGQIAALHEAIRYVLRKAIRYQGTSFDRAYLGGSMQKRLMVYGRDGEPCGACGTAIISLRVAQRGTHICPKCQSLNGTWRTPRRRQG